MNFILRFKNAPVCTAFICAVVAFIYQMFGIFGYTAPISQDMVIQILGLVINAFVAVGVLVDPTTKGFGDSERAMEYTDPA